MLFFISTLIFSQDALALEPECEWELQDDVSVQVGQISFDDNKKTFANIKNPQSQIVELDCTLTDAISLQDKLIDFEFIIKSPRNFEMQLSLWDISGNKIFTSNQIMNWYDISQDQRAHVVLDPSDFGIDRSSISDKAEGLNKKINNLKLTLSSNDYESITLTNSKITSVDEFPDFDLDDNLPIQSIIPGFLGLILISFPLGFVLLDNTRFLQKENFVHKIPWFLGFGFCIFIGFTYISSHFWISFEVVAAFVVFSLGVMALYLFKKKSLLISFKNTKSKKSIIFFSAILVISAIVAINYQESIGWPTGTTDSVRHVSIISLTAANHVIDDGSSYLPISDIPGFFGSEDPFVSKPYPRGAHSAAVGLSFLSGSFPAVSMESILAFGIFLIPLMLTSIVYKFSKSIFLSAVMYMITFWVSSFVFFGDIMLNKIATSTFASQVGILVMLTSFMIFIEYFEKGKKLRLFLYFLTTLFVLGMAYYPFLMIPIFIGIIGFVIFKIKDKKKTGIILGVLVAVFISMPLWTETVHGMVGLNQSMPFAFKWMEQQAPFDPSNGIFLLWVSSIVGLIFASFLVIFERYRTLSIIVITVSIIHLLAIFPGLAYDYTFFYQSLRTIGLMFLLSIAMILMMIHFAGKIISFKPSGYLFKTVRSRYTKLAILSLMFVVLFPGFQIYGDRHQVWDKGLAFTIGGAYDNVPGGNERNLMYWLYENTEPNDLILNDLSTSSGWILGFRAQNLVNGERQSEEIRLSYDKRIKDFNPKFQATTDTLRANEILRHPWDHDAIEEISNELNIRYIYISEREKFQFHCTFRGGENVQTRETCYPYLEDWPWKGYSGNARITMYENHPNLELILRNGNSAVFKVL